MADAQGMEFQAAQGTPDQLPQGAASALNEALPAPGQLDPNAELMVEGGDQPAPGQDGGMDAFPDGTETAGRPEFAPQGLDEEMLFLDTDPTEPKGVQLPAGRLPASVVRLLPYMAEAASDPRAPESLRAIYAATVNSLDSTLR